MCGIIYVGVGKSIEKVVKYMKQIFEFYQYNEIFYQPVNPARQKH